MSTLKVAAINNPSASSGGLAISASGNVTGAGLDLITTQSFSAASSVSVNNCFSATYDNYRVLVRYDTSAVNVLISLRFRTAGTDNSSAAYNVQSLDGYGSSITAFRSTAQTAAVILNSSGDQAYAILEVGQPFATWAAHGVSSFSYGASTGNIENNSRRFGFNGTTSFDGFTIYPASGSMDGQISVYGYRN